MTDYEKLNLEAWRTGKPFVAYGTSVLRAIDPEILREHRIMNGIINAHLDILAFNKGPEPPEEFYFGWCIGEMK